MKRLITLTVIFFTLSGWFHFSNPGNLSKSKIQNALQVDLQEVLSNEQHIGKPLMVKGMVSQSISTRWGGTLALQDDQSEVLILARSFTPSVNEQVTCVIIPRKVLVVGEKTFILCAMVTYQTQLRSSTLLY